MSSSPHPENSAAEEGSVSASAGSGVATGESAAAEPTRHAVKRSRSVPHVHLSVPAPVRGARTATPDTDLGDVITPAGRARRFRLHASAAAVRDAVLGFADGLTVPFALTAGLSSLGSTRLVVIGGLAELFSGAISMGLGAYLATATEAQRRGAEEERVRERSGSRSRSGSQLRVAGGGGGGEGGEGGEGVDQEGGEQEEEEERKRRKGEVLELLVSRYHVSAAAAGPVAEELSREPEAWIRFVTDLEVRLGGDEGEEERGGGEEDSRRGRRRRRGRAWLSALTMGAAYFVGGLIPMIPYFAMQDAARALFASIGVTVIILLAFGYVKTMAVTAGSGRTVDRLLGALQTLVVGVVAAGTSYGIVRGLDAREPVGAVGG